MKAPWASTSSRIGTLDFIQPGSIFCFQVKQAYGFQFSAGVEKLLRPEARKLFSRFQSFEAAAIMVFSSNLFLYGFLPAVFLLYCLTPSRFRNLLLLLASLLFYAWGEVFYSWLLLASLAFNYAAALVISQQRAQKKLSAWLLGGAITANIGLLGTFKYANFFSDSYNSVAGFTGLEFWKLAPVHLPIGISFFTFQAISYLVDVYRSEVTVQRNPINVFLYISFFPQLIAGPIIRYKDIAQEIVERSFSWPNMTVGFQRFLIGLGKKVLIANPLGLVADSIFALPAGQWSPQLTWVAIGCYTFQFYFDFSGYSDMAIGLGRVFGFHFRENFNYPFTALSMRDFWQRWHISLTTWVKHYLYIPLGGNRHGPLRQAVNLFFVFFLTGLWHGASWNFVLWGLAHGFFLSIERTVFGKVLDWVPNPFRYAYVVGVVGFTLILFRLEQLDQAFLFLQTMFGIGGGVNSPSLNLFFNPLTMTTLFAAAVGSTTKPLQWYGAAKEKMLVGELIGSREGKEHFFRIAEGAAFLVLCVLCASELAVSAHNPFLYFRF